MDKYNKLNLDEVFFNLLVEGTFFINGRGVVACGRVSSGEISPNSDVIITDESGYIIRYTRVSTIDYGFISKSPIPKSAKKVGAILLEGIVFLRLRKKKTGEKPEIMRDEAR